MPRQLDDAAGDARARGVVDHHGTAQDLTGVEARGHRDAHVVAAAAAGVVPGWR